MIYLSRLGRELSVYSGDFPVFVHGLEEMLIDGALGLSEDEDASAFGE